MTVNMKVSCARSASDISIIFSIVIIIVAVLLTNPPSSKAEQDFTLLEIPQGIIQGKVLKSRDGKTFTGYMGIPFAQPPKRFEPAKLPPPSWDDTYDATNYKHKCLQLNFTGEVQGNEDCLFINVFTPTNDQTKKLSVLAFIHGGGFLFGLASENGPEFFMDHDIVFVTFSYRLAALGFLSLDDHILSGNLGLKDQNLALKWISKNIIFFGGNKEKVTLFGESAGSASVSLHVLSHMSKDLFTKAICLSGSSLDRWPIIENAKVTAETLAEKLDCPTNSSNEIINCLKSKPGEDIVKVQLESIEKPIVHGPVIEQDREGTENEAFLIDHPRNIYDMGRFSKVPMITTLNDMEGLLVSALSVLANPELVIALNNDWMAASSSIFGLAKPYYSRESIKWATKRMREFYFGEKLVGPETLLNLTNIFTDSTFAQRTRRTALIHGKYAPVYVALLGFKGIWSQTFALGFKDILGMAHADDLSYLFTDFKYPQFLENSTEERFSKLLVQLFVNFANSGDPNYELSGKKWLPLQKDEIDTERINWLYLKNEPEFIVEPLEDRMKLWDQIDKVLETGVIPGKDEL